jgi:hypothetical protein
MAVLDTLKNLIPGRSVTEGKEVTQEERADFLKKLGLIIVGGMLPGTVLAGVVEEVDRLIGENPKFLSLNDIAPDMKLKENLEGGEGDPNKILNQLLIAIKPLTDWFQDETKVFNGLHELRSFVAKGYENKDLEKKNKAAQKEWGDYLEDLTDKERIKNRFQEVKTLLDQLQVSAKEVIGKELDYTNKGSLVGDDFTEAQKKHYIEILTDARKWNLKLKSVKDVSAQWDDKFFVKRYAEIQAFEATIKGRIQSSQEGITTQKNILDEDNFTSKARKDLAKRQKEVKENQLAFNEKELKVFENELKMLQDLELFLKGGYYREDVKSKNQEIEKFLVERAEKATDVLRSLLSYKEQQELKITNH